MTVFSKWLRASALGLRAGRHRHATHVGLRKWIAAGVVLLLTAVGVNFVVDPAFGAASGAISNPTITTSYDGTATNSLDPAPSKNNGIVASNDTVGFVWTITADSLSGGTLSQTLPKCWSWSTGSLGSLSTDNTLYSSTYVITANPDGSSTLTATISSHPEGHPEGQAGIQLQTLVATPDSSCANGSTYTPVLTATDSNGSQTNAASPIKVVDETRSDLAKAVVATTVGAHDFGSGSVPAYYTDYQVTVQRPQVGTPAIGAANTTLALPLAIADSYTPSNAGTTVQAEIVSSSLPAGDQAALASATADPNTITISGPAALDLSVGSYSVTVRLWVPTSQVPTFSSPVLSIPNTVSPSGTWPDAVSNADPNNDTATGNYQQPNPAGGSGGVGVGKDIWAANDPTKVTYNVNPAITPGFTNVGGALVAPGSVIVDRTYYHSANSPTAWDGTTNLVGYDFWDPSEQQIITSHGYALGDNVGNELPTSAYTVEYTTGTDHTNPAAMTWTATPPAVSTITGVRFIYTGGVYGAFPTGGTDPWYLAAIPFTVVGANGTTSRDTAMFTGQDAVTGAQADANASNFATVAAYALAISKAADKPSYRSGDMITYSIAPTLNLVPGAVIPVDANRFQVVDVMPSTIVSVNLSGLDPAWTATQSVDASNSITVTFTYVANGGVANTAIPIPLITYKAQTSIKAPANQSLTNSATLNANGIAGPTNTATVAVLQANVVTKYKISDIGSNIQVTDPFVSWTTTWINYLTASQGPSSFVDVLPYKDDPRGTHFNGTAKLTKAVLGGAAFSGGTLYYTTDPAASVSDAPAASTNWIAAGTTDLPTVNGITALKVEVADFAAGDAGVGSVDVTMAVSGQQQGDLYVNSSSGRTSSFGFPSTDRVPIAVTASSISGTVWNDADGNAADNGEAGLPGVTVNLSHTDTNGNTVSATTTTDSAGKYTFPSLHSGTYHVTVDTSTTPAGAVNTFSADGLKDNNSGPITLDADTTTGNLNFGYQVLTSQLTLTKQTNGVAYTAAPGAIVNVGSTVTWTYHVENRGTAPITRLAIADAGTNPDGSHTVVSPINCAATSLAPGATTDCTATGTALTGQYTNTATASATPTDAAGTPLHGVASVTSNSASSWYFGQTTGLTLVKKTNGVVYDQTPNAAGAIGALVAANSTVTWTYEVTNSGNAPVSGLTIADAGTNPDGTHTVVSPINCAATSLAPGATTVCTATGTAMAGQYMNTATANATPAAGPAITSAQAKSWYFGVTSGLKLVKTVNGTHQTAAPGLNVSSGSTVSWTYVVTNTGNYPVQNVRVSDTGTTGAVAVPSMAVPAGGLKPGDSMTFLASATAINGQYANTATATADAPAGGVAAPQATDQSWYFGGTSGITLDKKTNGVEATSTPGPYVALGSSVTWTYKVTNTGNTSLLNVHVTDDQVASTKIDCGGGTNAIASIAANASVTCTASGIATAGQYTNTATTTGTVADASGTATSATVTAAATSHYFGVRAALSIQKYVDDQHVTAAPGPTLAIGTSASWKYVVTNHGNTAVGSVAVTDASDSNGPVTGITCATLPPGGLAPGASLTCAASSTVVSGQYHNTASATASPLALDGSVIDPKTVRKPTATDQSWYNGVPAQYTASKTSSLGVGGTAAPGQKVGYTLTVSNTGQTPVTVTLADDMSGVLDDAGYNHDATASSGATPVFTGTGLTWTGTLAVGASATIVYSVTVSSPDAGDARLANALVVSGGNGSCPAAAPCTVVNPVVTPAGGLAFTGSAVGPLAEYGAALLLLGLAILLATVRRRGRAG